MKQYGLTNEQKGKEEPLKGKTLAVYLYLLKKQ